MKCNLIVAGFAKCGTSSLHEYLDRHPQICMSSQKEPHYFSVSKQRKFGSQWHDDLFFKADPSVEVFGESSTSYAVWEPALIRIKKELDAPKIILILREPLERLLSHYQWMYALGLEKMTLENALKKEERSVVSPDVSREGCYPWYRRTSNYSHFVPLIQMIFGQENVLIITSRGLLNEPQKTLDKCFQFLSVKEFNFDGARIKLNQTKTKKVRRRTDLDKLWMLMPITVRLRMTHLKEVYLKYFGFKQYVAPRPKPETIEHLKKELHDDCVLYSMYSGNE